MYTRNRCIITDQQGHTHAYQSVSSPYLGGQIQEYSRFICWALSNSTHVMVHSFSIVVTEKQIFGRWTLCAQRMHGGIVFSDFFFFIHILWRECMGLFFFFTRVVWHIYQRKSSFTVNIITSQTKIEKKMLHFNGSFYRFSFFFSFFY